MRERVTTLLDALGLLLVAGGAGGGMYPLIGWAAPAVSGAIVLGGSWWAARSGGSA